MERRQDNDLPQPTTPRAPVSARGLTTQELEAVIRRAVELQAGAPGRADEGVSEAEAVRIGQELGLDTATVRRAIAEVRGRPAEERGALARTMGPAIAHATRVLSGPADRAGSRLDRYLRDREIMVALRRFPDRTRYERDASFAAGMTRVARSFSRGHKPLDLKELDVRVSPLDADSCLVEVSTDLAGVRAGHAAGALGAGGAVGSGVAVTIWATPVADPLMLLGLPVVVGAWYGMRAIYNAVRRSTQEKLEALLDRLEHDELSR